MEEEDDADEDVDGKPLDDAAAGVAPTSIFSSSSSGRYVCVRASLYVVVGWIG